MTTLAKLVWGTIIYRPYVYVFFAFYLGFAVRRLGWPRTAAYTAFAYLIAFVSEWSSTRFGIPFGLYHYVDSTRTRELWISNVPFWDSLSFVFLSYFSWMVAALARGATTTGLTLIETKTAVLAGLLMMALDFVIDPVALRGDRWFLGRVYYYPHEGPYFGVTLTNFFGWFLVGFVIVLGCQILVLRKSSTLDGVTRPLSAQEVRGTVALYFGVFVFNWAITLWISEWRLAAASAAVVIFSALFVIESQRKISEGVQK